MSLVGAGLQVRDFLGFSLRSEHAMTGLGPLRKLIFVNPTAHARSTGSNEAPEPRPAHVSQSCTVSGLLLTATCGANGRDTAMLDKV